MFGTLDVDLNVVVVVDGLRVADDSDTVYVHVYVDACGDEITGEI